MLTFNYFGSNHRNPLLGYVLCNHFCYYWDRTSEITLPEFVVKINLLIYFQHQRHRHLHLTFKMYALLKCCWHYISLSTWRCINMSGFDFSENIDSLLISLLTLNQTVSSFALKIVHSGWLKVNSIYELSI